MKPPFRKAGPPALRHLKACTGSDIRDSGSADRRRRARRLRAEAYAAGHLL